MKDYYYVLGVSRTASQEEIKRAYRKLSKKFHPDVNNQDPFFADRFREIQEAYDFLISNAPRVGEDEKTSASSGFESTVGSISESKEHFWSRFRVLAVLLGSTCLGLFLIIQNLKYEPIPEFAEAPEVTSGSDVDSGNINSRQSSSNVSAQINLSSNYRKPRHIPFSNIYSGSTINYEKKIKAIEDKYDNVKVIDSSYFVVFTGGEPGAMVNGFRYRGGKCGVVNLDNEIVVPIVFSEINDNYYVGSRRNLSYELKTGEGIRFGFINLDSRFYTDPIYSEIASFEKIGWAKIGDLWMIIDSNGERLWDYGYSERGVLFSVDGRPGGDSRYTYAGGVLIDLQAKQSIALGGRVVKYQTLFKDRFIVKNSVTGEYDLLYANDGLFLGLNTRYMNHLGSGIYEFSNQFDEIDDCLNSSGDRVNYKVGLMKDDGLIVLQEGEYDGVEKFSSSGTKRYIGFCIGCESEHLGGRYDACHLVGGLWGCIDGEGVFMYDVSYSEEMLKDLLSEKCNCNVY